MSKPYAGPWIIRTLLFVAAHNDRYLHKAFTSGADCVVLDLEDAVPESKKETARNNVVVHATKHSDRWQALMVRLNSRQSGMLLQDLEGVACREVDGFIIPKVHRAEDVQWFDAQLAEKESSRGLPSGHFDIIVLMETPEAILRAHEIATASPRVIGLLFGHADFLTSMEGSHGLNDRGILVPRHMVSIAARAAGILAIDTFYRDVHDAEGLKMQISHAKELGFEGMLLMSPGQIEIAREQYTPNDKQVDEAGEMLRLAAEAEAMDRAIAKIDGVFVSPPRVERARKLLARHEAIRTFDDQRDSRIREEAS